MHNLIDPELSKLFQLSSSVSSTSIITRGHTMKLYQPKPRIDMFKFASSNRVVKLWNSLPGHVCLAVSLSSFKLLLLDNMCI